MIRLHNTLSKTKEELDAQELITVYTCGPTVYLDPHIGNWRTFIFYDTLARALKLNDHDVKHVINITDVGHLVSDGDTGEDKMSKTAKSQRKTAWEIAEQYTEIFLNGMSELNMLKPTKLPKATDHIAEQIAMIQKIEANGHAYTISDGVYFDTSTLDDYGKLAGGVKADEDFARINKNDEKRNAEDFALWKFSPKDEQRDMEWESPWGVGFPGWHIECSAMAQKYLGDTLDIHAGGVDHIPVHHTNEIAQSEAANGAPFARIWLHAEFMKVDGTKMSKSKNNFYTLEDVVDKGFSPLDFRMLVIQGHYRTETNFTWDNVQAAANRLAHLRSSSRKRWQIISEADHSEEFKRLTEDIMNAVSEDLNTPLALEALSKAATLAENGLCESDVQSYVELLQTADKALGLDLIASTPDISDDEKAILAERQEAREAKDYAKSDELRNRLEELRVHVLDGPNGQTWDAAS